MTKVKEQNNYAIEVLEKDKENLREYIDDCCIQAQKLIGTSDFVIWEKRREEMEQQIYNLQQTISDLKALSGTKVESVKSKLLKDFKLNCKFIIENNTFHFLEELFPFSDEHERYKKVSRDYIKNAVREIVKIAISIFKGETKDEN